MILILLGTQDKSFERLLKCVDEQIKLGNIKDKVIAQVGCTKYDSSNIEMFDLIPMEKLKKLVKESSFIITHGGVGSIIDSLIEDKKVIACPRLKKYNEHANDHQLQIVKKFSDDGYIIPFYETDDLGQIIKKIDSFKPKKYKSNTTNLIKILEDYIDNI